jgi:hypothetical protein
LVAFWHFIHEFYNYDQMSGGLILKKKENQGTMRRLNRLFQAQGLAYETYDAQVGCLCQQAAWLQFPLCSTFHFWMPAGENQ